MPADETKTGVDIDFEVSDILIPYLVYYPKNVRPELIRDRQCKSLWISALGGPFSYEGLVKSFARLSARLGVRVSPHDVRDAAATLWAIAAPDQIEVAHKLLLMEICARCDITTGPEASKPVKCGSKGNDSRPLVSGSKGQALYAPKAPDSGLVRLVRAYTHKSDLMMSAFVPKRPNGGHCARSARRSCCCGFGRERTAPRITAKSILYPRRR